MKLQFTFTDSVNIIYLNKDRKTYSLEVVYVFYPCEFKNKK